MRINEWFLKFMDSFKEGDSQITEKQYKIFEKYLDEQFIDGYIEGYRGLVNGYKVKAYRWNSVCGSKYYVDKCKA